MSLSDLRLRRRPAPAPPPPRSETRMQRLARGDVDALAELYVQNGNLVYTVACRFAGPNQADYITRAVFLHLWSTAGASDTPTRPVRLSLALLAYQLARA